MRPRHLFFRWMAVLACALPLRAAAQESKPPETDIVTVDLKGRAFGGTLPFDQEFKLRGALDTLTEMVTVRYGELVKASNGTESIAGTPYCGIWIRQKPLPGGPRAREAQFVLRIPSLRLDADTDYRFEFTLYEVHDPLLKPPPSDTECMTPQQLAAHFGAAPRPVDEIVIRGDTDLTVAQRFDSDVGAVWAPAANYFGAASGVHVFLRPVNKKLDLASLGVFESLPYRTTLYAGLAINQLGAGDGVKPTLGVGSPMVGFGFRGPIYWHRKTPLAWLWRPIRLNGGVIWFKQEDPNPLVDESVTKRAWFWSLTADLDLRTILGPFAALLTP